MNDNSLVSIFLFLSLFNHTRQTDSLMDNPKLPRQVKLTRRKEEGQGKALSAEPTDGLGAVIRPS